jgi:hypothetical protein
MTFLLVSDSSEAPLARDLVTCFTVSKRGRRFVLLFPAVGTIGADPTSSNRPTNSNIRGDRTSANQVCIDHEAILRQIPAEEKALTPPPSVFHARIHPFKRSPMMLRPRKSRKMRNSCGSADIIVHEDPQSPSHRNLFEGISSIPTSASFESIHMFR